MDVKSTREVKLGHDMEGYVILGAGSPPLAWALGADRGIGLVLLCDVVVRADGGGAPVQAMEPNTVLALAGDSAVAAVAEEAGGRLDVTLTAVRDRLA
ncbi:DUF302 domain-containing protein [Streptomyces mirabilis]|uniref:DUF302 domain-containing protein n=1 Tax=Streptomyces mirabilis TaxID=68239 RepID=UPI0033A9D08F